MIFKKHNPGCPCDCGESPPTGPCGCDATQIVIDFTHVDDIATIRGVRFMGGPCDDLNFEGFSALEGTYYVDWPETPEVIELARVAATNNPLYDALGNAFCLYGRITLSVPFLGEQCFGLLTLCLYVETWLPEEFVECSSLEDADFTNCVVVNADGAVTYDDNSTPIALCVADDGDITFATTNDTDCPVKTFNWQATWNPVL